jgi:hypothetical protein
VSGLQLTPLREAIAAQIKLYIQRDANVFPYQVGDDFPLIEIRYPDGTYVDYTNTFGATGISEVHLDVVITCKGSGDDAQRVLDDYLSMGDGNGSSVVEAICADKTFGGLAETCRGVNGGFEVVDATDGVEGASARIPIVVLVRKVGATV